MAKILLLDGDRHFLNLVSEWLENQYFTVDATTDGGNCQKLLLKSLYDVVILDWHQSDLQCSGMDICRWYRMRAGNTPILILAESNLIEDKEFAFECGADDYLTKPIQLRELTLRVNALTRRCSTAISDNRIHCGPLEIDPILHTASISGHSLILTATEFALLEYMGTQPNKILTTSNLVDHVWKNESDISPDTVRVYVKRVRAKLNEFGHRNLIENIHGVGYKLNAVQVVQQKIANQHQLACSSSPSPQMDSQFAPILNPIFDFSPL